MGGAAFIAVVCGLKSEAKAVARAVDRSDIQIGVSGANARRAEKIAARFCEQGAAAVVSVGVSGALDPALKPGDLVIGETVVADDGAKFESEQYLLGVIKSVHPRLRGDEQVKFAAGAIFGADEIIESVQKKAALFHHHNAIAVDMESHGAAKAAAQFNVPFIAIRAIADPANRTLPATALNAVAEDGSTRVAATLAAAMRDPKQLPALMKLGADSAAALKTLRRDLGPLFGRLFLSLDL